MLNISFPSNLTANSFMIALPTPRGGGTCQNFDKGDHPIFLRNLAKSYFSGLANFLAIFLGFAKFPLFLGLTNVQLFFWVFQFLYHTLESFE